MEYLIHNKYTISPSSFRIEGRNDYKKNTITIQRWVRKQLLKKQMKEEIIKLFEYNVIKIQRFYRKYKRDKEERIRLICIKMFEHNAITIQRFYRNYKIQKEIDNMKLNTI